MRERNPWLAVSGIIWCLVFTTWLTLGSPSNWSGVVERALPLVPLVSLGVLPGMFLRGRAATALVLLSLGTGVGIAYAQILPEIEFEETRAHEVQVLAELQSFIEAQKQYAELSGGFYESRLECLRETKLCLPRETERGPLWLEASETVRGTKDGYLRAFVPSEWLFGEPGGGSPTRVRSFAVIALPTDGTSGRYAFCLDLRGIRFWPRGLVPSVRDGRCY